MNLIPEYSETSIWWKSHDDSLLYHLISWYLQAKKERKDSSNGFSYFTIEGALENWLSLSVLCKVLPLSLLEDSFSLQILILFDCDKVVICWICSFNWAWLTLFSQQLFIYSYKFFFEKKYIKKLKKIC